MTHARPGEDAVPVNEPVSVTLNAGEEAVVEFSPIGQVVEHAVVVLAISKAKDTTYEISMDGTTVFGPSGIPPTDIDDTVQTFIPPRSFGSNCTVTVSNTGAATKTYHVQLIGYEQDAGGGA